MAKITCEWARDNKVYVNENGNVYPCCYWHYNINIRDVINEEFITKYGNDVALGKYNLKTKTLLSPNVLKKAILFLCLGGLIIN